MIRKLCTCMRLAVAGATLALLAGSTARAETIQLNLETASDIYRPGDTIAVEVFAATTRPLIGFGFDLRAVGGVSYDGFDAGPSFVGVNTPDGDFISGLSFTGGVDGTRLLLGTATYTADDPGDVTIRLRTTPGDLTEGFARKGKGFFDIATAPLSFTIAALTSGVIGTTPIGTGGGGGFGGTGSGDNGTPPIPEPATAFLLVSGLFAVCRRT